MKLDQDKIKSIIENNELDNLICRPIESRPGELGKFICGLANKQGGYILIGVERNNGALTIVGFQYAFDINSIMKSVQKKLSEEIPIWYGHFSVQGKNIFVIHVEKSGHRVSIDDVYYCYKSNGIQLLDPTKSNEPSTLFISYTECDAPIVDIIENAIQDKLKDKIRISRYTGLKYKDSFKEFMDTIQDHDFVLTVVSDTYLRKQACMYEVGETLKNCHYRNKLLFVVLSENERKYYVDNVPVKIGADIYSGAESKLEYITFWKNEYNKLEKSMDSIGDYEAICEATKELRIIGQIWRKDMGEFLQFLSDENGKSFEKLNENHFDDVIGWIRTKQ